MESKATVHEIIHALEQIEEAYGEGEVIEDIEVDDGKLTVYTEGAVIPIKLGDWE